MTEFITSYDPNADMVIQKYLETIVSIVLSECKELPVEAILLDGSLCAGEGVVWFIDKQTWVMSDVDILAISRGNSQENSATQEHLNLVLAQLLPEIAVDVWIGTHEELKASIKPTIAKINFTRNFRVVWGEADWLKAVGVLDPADIPHDDPVRLLLNRIMEHLLVLLLYLGERARIWDVLYCSTKAVLDMALVQLVLAGQYEYDMRSRVETFLGLIEKEAASGVEETWQNARLDVEEAMSIRSDLGVDLDAFSEERPGCVANMSAWWLRASEALGANLELLRKTVSEKNICCDPDILQLTNHEFKVGRPKTIKDFKERMTAWRSISSSLNKFKIPAPNKLQCAALALKGTPMGVAYHQGLWTLKQIPRVFSSVRCDLLPQLPRFGTIGSSATGEDLAGKGPPGLCLWRTFPRLKSWYQGTTSLREWLELANQAVLTWDLALLGGRRYAIFYS